MSAVIGTAEVRIVVPTADYDGSVRFHGELIGFTEQRSWPDPGRGVIYILAGNAVLELLDEPGAPQVTGAFCSVQVADAAGLAGRLAAAGVPASAPLGPKPWGHLSFEVTDPNGLRVVFFEVI